MRRVSWLIVLAACTGGGGGASPPPPVDTGPTEATDEDTGTSGTTTDSTTGALVTGDTAADSADRADSADSAESAETGATADTGSAPRPGTWTVAITPNATFSNVALASLLGDALEGLVLWSDDASGPSFPMSVGGLAEDGSQSLCTLTVTATASSTGGTFVANYDDLQVPSRDGAAIWRSATVSGTISSTSDLSDVSLSGLVDTRSLKAALRLPDTAPEDAVCGVLGAVGLVCGPCPDGSGDYCLPIAIEDLRGEVSKLVPIEVVTPDPSCDD